MGALTCGLSRRPYRPDSAGRKLIVIPDIGRRRVTLHCIPAPMPRQIGNLKVQQLDLIAPALVDFERLRLTVACEVGARFGTCRVLGRENRVGSALRFQSDFTRLGASSSL